MKLWIWVNAAAASLFLGCSAHREPSHLQSDWPADRVNEQMSCDFTNAYVDPILGQIPELRPAFPPYTSVWIRSGGEVYRVASFVEAAKRRIEATEGTPLRAGINTHLTLNPTNNEAFAEVIVGSGVGAICWVVTTDRNGNVTSYKKTFSKDELR